MARISKRAFSPIDQEEKDLMESIERDEWHPVKNIGQERKKAMIPNVGWILAWQGVAPHRMPYFLSELG